MIFAGPLINILYININIYIFDQYYIYIYIYITGDCDLRGWYSIQCFPN